ncbi:hypothetical protein [Bradyrhizobium sp. Cp5.3]|uniref:hypothetical protein n=1 Tax=Bradyrhizobium sp. Cp5.3 TaxID=443598 RepID=UPI000487212B|nr:hypothetical protein [Bradyrhizobium sp. Cp5.3]
MSSENCRAAIASMPPERIAERLHQATPEMCGCEAYQLGDTSPGRVADAETLNLIVSDPNSLLPDGTLNPSMLVQLDYSGVSVLRNSATNDEFELTLNELKARSTASGRARYFHGVCAFAAAVVRYDQDSRLVGVYDTSLPQKPNHADMIAPDMHAGTGASNSQKERDRRKRHKRVIELIGTSLVPARQFRSGAFLAFARS